MQDFGRGCPVDFNKNEGRYNWELVFCELYAGGKYKTNEGESYEYSLGLNGLGLCATQYSSEYMDVEVFRDGFQYKLHFEKGEIAGEFQKKPISRRQTGSKFKWRPDRDVFTDIDIPFEWFEEMCIRDSAYSLPLCVYLFNFIYHSITELGCQPCIFWKHNCFSWTL